MQQLQHKVPRAALLEDKKGKAAMNKLQFISAADHFKTAVYVDPAFADGYNNLGVAYLRLEEYQQSMKQFQKPSIWPPLINPQTTTWAASFS